jgi:hypothetical protein
LYIFPTKNAQNFIAKRLFSKFKNNNFIGISHIFDNTPVFLPFKPKTSRIFDLTKKLENPTLIPFKVKNDNWGYYGPNPTKPKTIAIINMPK